MLVIELWAYIVAKADCFHNGLVEKCRVYILAVIRNVLSPSMTLIPFGTFIEDLTCRQTFV